MWLLYFDHYTNEYRQEMVLCRKHSVKNSVVWQVSVHNHATVEEACTCKFSVKRWQWISNLESTNALKKTNLDSDEIITQFTKYKWVMEMQTVPTCKAFIHMTVFACSCHLSSNLWENCTGFTCCYQINWAGSEEKLNESCVYNWELLSLHGWIIYLKHTKKQDLPVWDLHCWRVTVPPAAPLADSSLMSPSAVIRVSEAAAAGSQCV